LRFVNKRILLISPQKWDGLKVSKHHYAEELARRGNQVYFLEPPEENLKLEINPSNVENVFIVKHGFSFNRKLRFHFRVLFDMLIKRHLKKINKKLRFFDFVWCFDSNLYSNLNWVNSKYKIYHPVDQIGTTSQVRIGNSSDIIFSVSNSILTYFKEANTPSFFINHGLSNYFHKDSNFVRSKKLRFAYIGNLMIRGLDRERIMEVIKMHPEIDFDFYGNYIINSEDSFISFLKVQSNSHLKGTKTTVELALLLNEYTGFIICYNPDLELNNGSNSHKILEYLSFGKVIVANKILHYEQHRDLIQMSTYSDNSDFVELFHTTVSNLEKYNTRELFKKRRALAFKNTYSKQITRIEEYLSQVIK
jgi:hypothetical protein